LSVLNDREAGVCLHLTSLPDAYGIGTLGVSALRFLEVMSASGLRVWQFLPTGPTAFGDSPYQTTSVFAGNPMLLDLRELASQGLVTASELEPLQRLSTASVDFDRLVPLKSQLLARAAERFERTASSEARAAREQFIAENDDLWLHDYAMFEVLKAMHQQRTWSEWNPLYAQRDPDAMRTFEEAALLQIRTVKTTQYFFAEQWRTFKSHADKRGIRLMADAPIYVALDSADVWARPELFDLDDRGVPIAIAGVPPDYFSADGQLWGNPLYRWDRHAAEGYVWWTSRLKHSIQYADMLRLDHFRGFESYWAVPADAKTARTGEWRPGPGTALFDAMTAALGELPIIAEDLGVITPAVDALRARYGFPGMKVLQFMVGEDDFDPTSIPHDSVCYTGTHDNDTTVGWFQSDPGDTRSAAEIEHARANVLRHTQGCAETVHIDLVRLAFSTPAALAIVPLQDFLGLGSSARLNTPGTTKGNWRWRLPESRLTPHFCASVRQLVAESGRIGSERRSTG